MFLYHFASFNPLATPLRERERTEENIDCINWWKHLNSYGKRHTPPTPKDLIIRDLGRRLYSREDIMKRTAWLGRALEIKTRTDLPPTRVIKIRDEQCTSIHIENPDLAMKMLEKQKQQ
jgi:hypothetical protein